MSPKITPDHLSRGATVYIRQSTMAQVVGNTESQRRQYGLADAAHAAGFASVTVIDDDLGRSGSGAMDRPGFEKLVASVCAGMVGAVYCLEASRLARNGRDGHHLIDLCALAGTLVVDPEGAYDPRLINDRLLLGLKGTMSEYELSLLRQRGLAARDSKPAVASSGSRCRPAIAGARPARSSSIPTSMSPPRSGSSSASSASWAAAGRCSSGCARPASRCRSSSATSRSAGFSGSRPPITT
jgi:DNA invertase Pin-like site-specific DNA recombinase